MFKKIVQLCLAVALVGGVQDVARADQLEAFSQMVGHYELVRQALLHDTTEGVADHAKHIAHRSMTLSKQFSAETAGVAIDRAAECQELLPEIAGAAEKVAAAQSLEEAREAFGELSKPMVRYREMVGAERPIVVYCPMVKKAWLQPEGELENPYFGQEMPRCGEVVSK